MGHACRSLSISFPVKGLALFFLIKTFFFFFLTCTGSSLLCMGFLSLGSMCFPGSSAGKESTCNAGDPGPIPESGRCTGEEIGYPLQYYWASLVAQMVKNLPTMQETWVRSLGQEDLLEKGTATHSSILAWRVPWTEEPGRLQSTGLQRVRYDCVTFTFMGSRAHGLSSCSSWAVWAW